MLSCIKIECVVIFPYHNRFMVFTFVHRRHLPLNLTSVKIILQKIIVFDLCILIPSHLKEKEIPIDNLNHLVL